MYRGYICVCPAKRDEKVDGMGVWLEVSSTLAQQGKHYLFDYRQVELNSKVTYILLFAHNVCFGSYVQQISTQ